MANEPPFHNPFGALSALKARLPQTTVAPDPTPAAPTPAASNAPSIPRAVVRMERSGRGGKEATVIEQLSLSPAEQLRWLKALKSTLGCGGSIEGDTLMLQGDQRSRLPAILQARGVKKVTVG